MSGIFGVVSKEDCISVLFYGTDYHSHLGTEYGGLAVLGKDVVRIDYKPVDLSIWEPKPRMY